MTLDDECATVDVHLRLTAGADPVTGRLLDPAGHETGFEGYVELIAALERLLDPDRQPH